MQYFTRSYFIILLFTFAFLALSLTYVANQTYLTSTPQQANQTLQQIQAERQTLTPTSIFIHNLLISMAMLIPLIGLIPFYLAWQNTAVVIGLLAKATGIPPNLYISNLLTLAFPEVMAYTFLFAENLYVSLLALFKAGATQRITAHSWKTVIIWLILLAIGAITEMMLIG